MCLAQPWAFLSLQIQGGSADGLLAFSFHRWIKFEEKVEDGGERWSKPHITALSLHSLFELRTCIKKGMILLDLDAHSLKQIVGRWIMWEGHLPGPYPSLATGWAPGSAFNESTDTC